MNAQPPRCPSRFDLAAWPGQQTNTSDKPSFNDGNVLGSHVSACSRCRAYVQELHEARRELLGADPTRASHNAARVIMATAEARKRARWRWQLAWPMAALPAAALIGLFVMSNRAARTNDVADEAPTYAANTIRTKGSFALAIVAKRGDDMFKVGDGDEVRAGDRLRFEYTQLQPGFLMVFSVDDAGTISPYYDDQSLKSLPVAAGTGVALPDSIELDDHKGLERIFAVWSAQPLDGAAVTLAVQTAMLQSGGNVGDLTKLPIDAQQTSVLLRRP